MAELSFDVVKEILVRMDAEDLIRCKSACKSWQSFISTPRFVKAHLNHYIKRDHDNHQLGHRRICHSESRSEAVSDNEIIRIVGSCNGLVCFSPRGVRLVVTNPSTREQKKLPTPRYRAQSYVTEMIRHEVCWGFGYDLCADDYKVIVGFMNKRGKNWTTFYGLTLKSNRWKVIGKIRYEITHKSANLCGGALYWFMRNENKKKVIISFDLSTSEFREIPQPDLTDYVSDIDGLSLGVLEDCLCIYRCCLLDRSRDKMWVMKNTEWELYIDHCQTKYDVAHFMPHTWDSRKMCSLGDGTRVPNGRKYIGKSIFVKSLASISTSSC